MKKRSLTQKEETAVIQALRLSSTLLTMTEYRNMAIEQCAREVEEYSGGSRTQLAAIIRALKEKS